MCRLGGVCRLGGGWEWVRGSICLWLKIIIGDVVYSIVRENKLFSVP